MNKVQYWCYWWLLSTEDSILFCLLLSTEDSTVNNKPNLIRTKDFFGVHIYVFRIFICWKYQFVYIYHLNNLTEIHLLFTYNSKGLFRFRSILHLVEQIKTVRCRPVSWIIFDLKKKLHPVKNTVYSGRQYFPHAV